MTLLRIATRKSPLALWQANYVKSRLQNLYPDLEVELLGMLTTADKMFTTPLNQIGGKGLFVKELEKAILENRADIAVHSIKDMPAELPDGLELGAILTREDPRDVFLSNNHLSLLDLPKGAILGTSSLRRRAQALAMRQDLVVKPLRGNIGARLQKLEEGKFDGIILAAAGLNRLNLASTINSYFNYEQMLPAAGQGAIGIECRASDKQISHLISPLNDADTWDAIFAERILNARLGGSCQFPIASLAIISKDTLTLRALVGNFEGTTILKTIKQGSRHVGEEIAMSAADDLIEQGALDLLEKMKTYGG